MFPCQGKYPCTRIKRQVTCSLLGLTHTQRERMKSSLLPTTQSMLSCTLKLASMPTMAMAITLTLASMYCWNIQILSNLIIIQASLQENFISVANCSFTLPRFVFCYRTCNQNSIIKTNNLFDEALTEVGYLGSWARFGPWLPWMEMGLTSGGCLYNAPFFKLNSVEDLPETLYQWTVDNYPSFLQSPRNYSTPNLTSWRYFKNIIDKRRQDGEEDIQVPEQPDKSEDKTAYLDGDLMDHIGELGWIRASFQGSRYYVFGELTN